MTAILRGLRSGVAASGTAIDLTDPQAIEGDRRRRWLRGMLLPAAGVMCGLALLSLVTDVTGSAAIQFAVALCLAWAWQLTVRGRTEAAYVMAALVIPFALVIRPLLTGNANDNILYLGVAGMFLLMLAPRRWSGMVVAGSLLTAAILYFGTSATATPDLGWTTLAVNGLVVSAASLLLGVLALRSTHGALAGAYASRDHARQLTTELEAARAGLERDVHARTAHLRQVLAESEALVAELAAQSLRDHLTGLPNRRFLDEELPRRIAAADADSPLTVVLLDLVHFKAVNDDYSHDVGDRALQTAASLLAAALTDGDTICRYGGDEFVVLMSGATPGHVAATVARMQSSLAATTLTEAPTVRLGLAAGHTTWTPSAGIAGAVPTAATLLRAAEADLRSRRTTPRRRRE